MQWYDVQKKLIEAQKTHHMCVHKAELTELGMTLVILISPEYSLAHSSCSACTVAGN